MTHQPFVGVCGVQTARDLDRLQQLAPAVLERTGRFLMAGIKHAGISTAGFCATSSVRPFVHCDFTANEDFERIVERNISASWHFVRGLQLNVLPWMEVDYSALWTKLKRQYPGIALILQAHQHTTSHYSPWQIATRLRDLNVDYILFDASQSRGIPYDLQCMRTYVNAAHKARPDIGVVVAGGLHAPLMDRHFGPLAEDYPLLSCDAFGRLQDPTTNALSWPRVEAYLHSAATILARQVYPHVAQIARVP